MAEIIKKRMCAELEGEFVVFLVAAMTAMRKELAIGLGGPRRPSLTSDA